MSSRCFCALGEPVRQASALTHEGGIRHRR